MSESVNVGVTVAEELENSELSDCSLDVSCSTVTQSASSPSEPDQEGSLLPDSSMTVLKAKEVEAEGNEVMSDSSTVSAENTCSTVSAPSSSELEQEKSLRRRSCGPAVDGSRHWRGRVKRKLTDLKNGSVKCVTTCSSADLTICQPVAVTTADISNKDQIVISASNRVQNYLASLGLPGTSVLMWMDL